jgi:hypothetical protein
MKRALLTGTLCAALAVALAAQGKPPAWVQNNAAAYPDKDWISAVESAPNRNTAESLALNALARTFKVDVRGTAAAEINFAQTINQSGSKKMNTFTGSQSFSQEVISQSNVSGLVGVQSDTWTAPDGEVFANARMNRRECAARYAAAIRENAGVIKLLITDAETASGAFDAYEYLNVAASLAAITDNYQSILEVLDSSAVSRRPAYGGASAIKKMAQDKARAITIVIAVNNDVDARINRAFTSYFNQRGFKTNLVGNGDYAILCLFSLDDVETSGSTKAARYTLSMTLTDLNGTEVFAYSGNGRQNHNSQSEARQRALRAAEDSITKSGFGAEFDKYLLSLLK